MKKLSFLFLIGLFLSPILSIVPAQAADPLNIDVIEDTFSNEAYPERDFSTSDSIVLSQTPTNREGYFLFDGITLPESAILQSVDFNFYIDDFNGDADLATLEFRNVSTEWSESLLNWDDKPSTSGSLNHTVDTSEGWKKVDITSLAEDWYGIYMTNNGLYVRVTQPDMAITLSSSNSTNIPYLEIGYLIDMPTPPVDCPLVAWSPSDSSEIPNSRPTFRWDDLTCLSSDVFEVRLLVNKISDDGEDALEIINISIPVDSTFFTPTEDLDSGNYRWYLATLNSDGIGIDRSESNGFQITEGVKSSDKAEDETKIEKDEKEDFAKEMSETPNSYLLLYVVLIVCLIAIAVIVVFLVIRKNKNNSTNQEPPLFK